MGKSTVDASAGFGLRDKLAYAAGDFGCNMSFALKGYLTIYWTQFMGIDNYLMASLLLIVQIWDAINDPIIGAMVDADTHKYRRNKFLAYIWLRLFIFYAPFFAPITTTTTINRQTRIIIDAKSCHSAICRIRLTAYPHSAAPITIAYPQHSSE